MSDDRPDPGAETETEQLERLVARALVASGGAFWMIAAFAGPYVYRNMSLTDSIRTATWPFLTAAVILAIGWRYQRLAAVLLFGASAAVLVRGTLYGWEPGVWMIMTCVLIAPMVIAGILFLLAARAEDRRSTAAEQEHAIDARSFRGHAVPGAHASSRG
ncbi:MAG: hypothetical protein Q7W30_05990 [Coriobacteriia bacterium]|nr:hypothetical protein [Coriobacteriia bacterium]